MSIRPLNGIRRAVASRMALSKKTIPHLYIGVAADVTGVGHLRKGPGPGLTTYIAGALRDALIANPALNGVWTETGPDLADEVVLSIAVATSEGIVAPSIALPPGMDLGTMDVEIQELVQRARSKRLRPSDMAGAGFSLSNIGPLGVTVGYSIVTPPQLAVLCAGATYMQLAARDGQVFEREMIQLSLSADHRAVDGEQSCQFLRDVKGNLEAAVSSSTVGAPS
ncbi:MAG: hypothetical protein EON54_02245 [Alcaligenaceae bacterium]|nr:MAG: hypothetical protein EON54_02245 [Alcaligenaceae bacterium]